MKDFTEQSELKQVNEQARQIWQQFNDKMRSLTVTTAPRNVHFPNEVVLPLSKQEKQAATYIANWWRSIRNSQKTIPFNANGAHPPEFHTLLNNQPVQKRLSHAKDQQLLKEITTAPWQSALFRDESMQHSALNLFAAGKISWQQKATFSLVNESMQCYGEFEAIALLDDNGLDFSPTALRYIAPFLKYTPFYIEEPSFLPKDGYLSDEEMMLFLALVRQLPKSEQFIFIFKEQHRSNANYGHPTPDTVLRAAHSRYIERDGENYQGILLVSHGIRNAIGLAHYSVKNWTPLIPRLGAQTIDDVDFFINRGARVAVSGDSRALGLVGKRMNVHGLPMYYPDNFMHDEYHSLVASSLGANALQGFRRVIELARDRFDKRWSKDLWFLCDADFGSAGTNRDDMDSASTITKRFASGLTSVYHVRGYLDDCDEDIKSTMEGKPFLFGPDQYPNQILLNFVIDLVRNPHEWHKLNINMDTYGVTKALLILRNMAIFLNQQGIFQQDTGDGQQHKLNILRFDCFVRAYGPLFVDIDGAREWMDWNVPREIPEHVMEQIRNLELECEHYQVKQRNKSLLFGFVKEQPEKLKARSKKRERDTLLAEEHSNNNSDLCQRFLEACRLNNLAAVEDFLDNHHDLLDAELFVKAIEQVKSIELAEILLIKSGKNKYPKNDKGEYILPIETTTTVIEKKRPREDSDMNIVPDGDEYLRQENRLLQQQVASLQELANLRLGRILELEERLEINDSLKRKKNNSPK